MPQSVLCDERGNPGSLHASSVSVLHISMFGPIGCQKLGPCNPPYKPRIMKVTLVYAKPQSHASKRGAVHMGEVEWGRNHLLCPSQASADAVTLKSIVGSASSSQIWTLHRYRYWMT